MHLSGAAGHCSLRNRCLHQPLVAQATTLAHWGGAQSTQAGLAPSVHDHQLQQPQLRQTGFVL